MKSSILAIESSTEVCSVAIQYGGETYQKMTLESRRHSEFILPAIDLLISELGITLADLEVVAFAGGPGAFTGLRIAAAITQGLAFGLDLPVVQISSLATLAQAAHRKFGLQKVVTCVDARMNEVYWASYQFAGEIMVLNGAELICSPEASPEDKLGEKYAVGSGKIYQQIIQTQNSSIVGWKDDCLPEAQDLVKLAKVEVEQQQFSDPEQALPVYLRDKISWKKLPGR